MVTSPVEQMFETILGSFETRQSLAEIEQTLDSEYACATGLAYRPGMLRLVTPPLVLNMLVKERIRNLAMLEALEKIVLAKPLQGAAR